MDYVTDKIKAEHLSLDDYVSTENMLPERNGIMVSSGIPRSGNATEFLNGDILISNIRPYFKKIWFADKNGGCSNDILVLRGKDDKSYLTKYLYYVLSANQFFDYVMAGSKGTKMPRGDKTQILKYPMRVPPIEEQKEIAAILSSLDDKIELNQQINKKLEEVAQAIFKEWFIDFNFPDENGNPYRNSCGVMVDSELGLIPASWSVGKLGDMIETVIDNRGKTPPIVDNGIPIVEVNAIDRDSQYPNWQNIKKYVDQYTFDTWFRGYIRENDILIPTVGTIGNLSLMDDNIACIAQNIVAIRTNHLYSSYYVFYLLKRSREILLNLNIGGVQPSIKVPHLLNIKCVVPESITQMKFEAIVASLSSKINNEQIVKLVNIRDTLLPKLMSEGVIS
jgi:type I restriction enzyme S subunit